MLISYFGELFRRDNWLSSDISNMASLSASLAAVSLAVFLVLPTFRGLIEREQHPGYSEYEKLKRLFRGFTSLGIASILFSIGTALGVIGQHWSCKALLLC